MNDVMYNMGYASVIFLFFHFGESKRKFGRSKRQCELWAYPYIKNWEASAFSFSPNFSAIRASWLRRSCIFLTRYSWLGSLEWVPCMPKLCPILLVIVSLIYSNNFSIMYIHLKAHFFGKLNNWVYNWPIGWRTAVFLSLLSLLVSHNVGSHTTQHASYFMRYLVLDTKQGRTSKNMLLFGQGEFL